MTIARRQLIDVDVTRWYHCMSRCVRGASLLGNESSDRKEWLEKRIEELAQVFAIGVGGFSVRDNHLRYPAAAKIAEVPETSILDGIGSSAECWQRRMEKLGKGRWFGRFFAASGGKLREMASRLKVRRVINLAGCAAP